MYQAYIMRLFILKSYIWATHLCKPFRFKDKFNKINKWFFSRIVSPWNIFACSKLNVVKAGESYVKRNCLQTDEENYSNKIVWISMKKATQKILFYNML